MSRPLQLLILATIATATFFLGRLTNTPSDETDRSKPLAKSGAYGSAPVLSANPRTKTSQEQSAAETVSPIIDPVKMLREAMNSPTNIGRQRDFAAALLNMRSEDGPAVHQLFLDGDAEGRYFYGEWGDFWTRWGEVDPLGALKYINSGALGEPQMGSSTSAVLPSIGHQGEDAARAFLQTVDLGKAEGNQAAMAVIGGLAEVDLEAATRIALANSEAPFFRQAVDSITEAAVQSGGLENLKSWYDELPEDSPMRQAALRSAFDRIGRAGFQAEREWLDHLGKAGPLPDPNIANYHAFHSMDKDPLGTIDWVDNLPKTENNKNVLPNAITNWADKDQAAANAWLDANLDRPDYDNLATAFAKTQLQNHPESALERAATIRDEAIRTKLMQSLKEMQENSQR